MYINTNLNISSHAKYFYSCINEIMDFDKPVFVFYSLHVVNNVRNAQRLRALPVLVPPDRLHMNGRTS